MTLPSNTHAPKSRDAKPAQTRAEPKSGAAAANFTDSAPSDPRELPNARELQQAAETYIAARRQRPFDEMAQRRREIKAQLEAFLAAVPPPDMLDRVTAQVRRAAAVGEMIAHIYRFPSEYCTDRGRSLNNAEPDWPSTLQGLARAHFDLLHREFTPRGFHIGAQIVTWPMLMPGDVSLLLSWRK